MRGLACEQKTGRESLRTRSLVADGRGVATGRPEPKTSEKKLLEERRRAEPPADQPQTKIRPKAGQEPEASDELLEDLRAPTWNLPSEGVFLVESGRQPEEIPVEPEQEPGGSRRYLSLRI